MTYYHDLFFSFLSQQKLCESKIMSEIMFLELKLEVKFETIYLIYQVDQVSYQHRKWVTSQSIVLARMIPLLVKILSRTSMNDFRLFFAIKQR